MAKPWQEKQSAQPRINSADLNTGGHAGVGIQCAQCGKQEECPDLVMKAVGMAEAGNPGYICPIC